MYSGGVDMMGVITLILIVVVIGVFSSVVFSSPNTRSRVDWSKVMLVFLGIPFLLIAALGGTYFLSQSQAQHEVAVAQSNEQIAREMAALERERALRALDKISVTEQVAAIPGEAESESSDRNHDSQEAHVPQHQMPSHIGTMPIMDSPPTLFLLVIAIGVVVGSFVCLYSMRKNKLALTFSCILLAGILLGGGLFTYKVAEVDYTKPRPAPIAKQSTAQAHPVYEDNSSGLIPVGEEEEANAKVEPLKILERDYDFSHGTSISSKAVSRIPNWVEEAMAENIIRPDQNELVITSKRYSSIEEAEAELNRTAEILVTDYVVGIYPEMRETWIDSNQIRRLGMLEKSCEITWPFQVGEFKDKVYQVTWQLDVTSRIQHDLHDAWERDSLSQKLVYLGGGFGLVTLVFGIGAVVTRGGKQETA